MSIPKVINYCWFGGKPLNELALKCIESWKKYCPDYEIRCWNEDNFDVTKHPYMKEAYDAKKWAFVTDIARLMIIYENGGIYFDTDVELVKPIDHLLEYDGFFGYEGNCIATGLGFGAIPKHPFLQRMLDDYEGVAFVKEDGRLNVLACPERNTASLKEIGLKGDGTYQIIDKVHFLPEEYLCPMSWKTHELVNYTDNTLSIHRYATSWKKWYEHDKYKNPKALTGIDKGLYWIAGFMKTKDRLKRKVAHRKNE